MLTVADELWQENDKFKQRASGVRGTIKVAHISFTFDYRNSCPVP
jgi:hypothetical protein